MIKTIFSFALTLVGLMQILGIDAHAQSCLSLETLHDNPDSTYIDTCSSSSTFRHMYCRRDYKIEFSWYVIKTPLYGTDTSIVYGWTAIDSSYASIRSAFAALETAVGKFTITKTYTYIADTSSELNKIFFLRFDSLLDVDSSLSLLSEIPGMNVKWYGAPALKSVIPAVNGLVPGLDFQNSISLVDSSSYEDFTRYLHPLGWQWSIYTLHCPMAWEITMGTPAPGSA